MSKNRWDTILPIFDAVRSLPRAERDAHLLDRCGDDADLRREVESLLSHDEGAGERFLKPGESALPSPQPDGPDPLIGATVASYTISSIIAAGGMGTVYLAEQASPRRHVALKVMSAGLWSKSAERRFEFESQVLARLRHPNIAQVYEAGTHRLITGATVHYFAMEYIPNARTITAYANEAKLNIRERLEHFLPACDAVLHGHQRGIIHRDLKPGNILVGTEADMNRAATGEPARANAATKAGVAGRERSPRKRDGPVDEHAPLPHGRGSDRAQPLVKIIDFGIARATDSDVAATTMHTETGALIGTLAYMSPEQCDADPLGIDTRSDVYSLGVVLYELLCGRLPYDVSRTSIVKAARTICEAPPERPSAITQRATGFQPVKGDLEFLLLKTLEKNRERRYASADDLAADIRRYLNHEPLAARPPTTWTKSLRWAARNPRAATASACSAIALLFALGIVSSVYSLNARPDHLKTEDDMRQVQLRSLAGRIWHTWDSQIPTGVRGAQILRESGSGRRLAVIGFQYNSAIFPGQLCAFDIDGDLEEPIWKRTIEAKDELPDDLKKRGPAFWDFGVRAYLIADVFPDAASPGDEIVVSFNNSRSQQAIRIYNIKGDLIYQVWQDGGVSSFHWMSKAGLLVCAGGDEHPKDSPANRQAGTAVPGCIFAPVVFAIRPKLTDPPTILREYLDLSGEKQPAVAWCRWFDHASSDLLQIEPSVNALVGALDAGEYVRLDAKFQRYADQFGGIGMILDERGNEIQTSRAAGDDYERNRGVNVPQDVSCLQLRPVPPDRVWEKWMIDAPSCQTATPAPTTQPAP